MYRPMFSLSRYKGIARAASSWRSSVTGRNDCVSGFTSHGLWATQVGSHFLDESQMQWSSAYTGAAACHARTPTKVFEGCPDHSTSGPSSRRQATAESEFLSEICASVPDANVGVLSEECGSVKESRGAGTRSFASSVPTRRQRGGQRNQRRKRASTCAEAARVASGRHHRRLPMLVDHLTCRDGRSEESLLERRAVGTLAARRNDQTALGTFLKLVKARALPLVEDVEIDGALVAYSNDCFAQGVQHHHFFAASCCRDGLLAVNQPLFGSRKHPRFHRCLKGWRQLTPCVHSTSSASTCLGRHCKTTRPSQSSSYGSVHLHLAGNVHASVRASGIDNERSCPTACAISPMLVGRDRSFRSWSVYQNRNPQWVSPYGSALASMGQQAPARTQGRTYLEDKIWNVEYPAAAKNVPDCNRHFGSQRHDYAPNAPQWSQHRAGARCRDEVRGKRSAVSKDTTKAVVWRPTTTLRAHSETSWKLRYCSPGNCKSGGSQTHDW